MEKNNKGITLVALVITIIVLLILAGISMAMLTGDNGILNQSTRAKEETIIGQEKEQVEIAYNSVMIEKLGDNITAKELQAELESIVGMGKTITQDNDERTINVKFTDTEHYYLVENGKVSKTDAPPTLIYFSFYNSKGEFRETFYAYSGQTWNDWQESGLASEQEAFFSDNGNGLWGNDNLWTTDIMVYYDREHNLHVYGSDLINNGGVYYTY